MFALRFVYNVFKRLGFYTSHAKFEISQRIRIRKEGKASLFRSISGDCHLYSTHKVCNAPTPSSSPPPNLDSFLRCLRLRDSNSHMSSPIRQDSRKRRGKNREGISGMNLVFRGSDGRTYASNCFNYLSHRRVSEMGTVAKNGGEVIVELDQEVDLVPNLERQNSSFEEERENVDVPVQEKMEKEGFLEAKAREKAVDAVLGGGGGGEGEDREIGQMGIASLSFENSAIQSENESVIAQVAGATELPMNIDVQGFMLLMKMLCPVETTIYPGFNGNEVVIGPMDDPSTSKNMKNKPNQEEKRDASSSSPRRSFNFDSIEEIREEELPGEEMKPRYKDNKRDRKEMEGLAAFPELSDSDGETKMDAIPLRVLCRPPTEYKDKLIKVLKRPFDKSEYRELMNEATLKKRKIVYKEMRFGRKRAVETDEKSKSIFDQYPEVKSQVERARRGRRLTLLRGLFFWLTNCCNDESFMPWKKGYEGSTVQLTINDSKKLQNNISTGPNCSSKPKSDRKEDTHKQAMEEQDEVLSPTTNLKLPPAVFVPSTRSRGKGTREKSSVAAQKERQLAAALEKKKKKKNTQTRQKAKRMMATGGEPRISVRLKIPMSQ